MGSRRGPRQARRGGAPIGGAQGDPGDTRVSSGRSRRVRHRGAQPLVVAQGTSRAQARVPRARGGAHRRRDRRPQARGGRAAREERVGGQGQGGCSPEGIRDFSGDGGGRSRKRRPSRSRRRGLRVINRPRASRRGKSTEEDEEELRQHRQRVHGRGRVRRRRTTCQTRGSTQPTARSAQRALLAHRRAQGTRGARAQRARSLRPAFTSGADTARRAGGGRRHARRRRGRRGGRRRPRPDHRAGRSHGFVTVASQEKARVAG